MSVKIKAVSKELPPFSRKTREVIPFVETWLEGQEERFRRKVVKIFEGAAVEQRYSIMDPEDVFTATSFEDKNNIYSREMKKLGEAVLRKTLEKAGWEPDSLDILITVSCTGIMIPSLDAYLINDLGLRRDILRLPITEMGCAAGISGMIYATRFLRAAAGKRAAVVAVESPAATLQLDDFSMANMVSAAIFGDGAACALLTSEAEAEGPEVVGQEMYHFYNSTELMGFDLTNNGLKMVLDPAVPQAINDHFTAIINPFLEKHQSNIEKVDHLIFHPGGKKIVQTVEDLFGNLGKNIEDTKAVLREYGNMSSATVLYVLERFMDKSVEKDSQGLMLSFGPGFSAQQILLKW